MSNDLIRRYVTRSLPIVAALSLASPAAYAWDFQNDDGTFSGSWDTTLTYGQAWRIESRDCRLIAIADGGCGRSPNIDDGNLNYDTDMYSRALKVLTELSLNYRGIGAFVRASGLYDDAANTTQRTPLSDKSEDLVVSYTRLLDAFVYAKFDLGKMGAELRLGRQVVSWGESTFIQNGINVINHFDVSALRVPGSELKEGFLPQEMVNFSLQFSDNWSAQAIYITDWNATVPEPAGSYYSANDFAPIGGSKVVLGFGSFSDQGVDFRPLGGPYITNFQTVNRLPTIKASDDGQYGFNLKYFAPDFNNGTEFGLFFLNYHSRLPLISGHDRHPAGRGQCVRRAERRRRRGAGARRRASRLRRPSPRPPTWPLRVRRPRAATSRWRRRRSTPPSARTRSSPMATWPRRPATSPRTSTRSPPATSPSIRKTSS